MVEEKEKVKTCPFLNDYCKKERCALYSEMKRSVNSLPQKFGMCSFNAMVVMLSELNSKAKPHDPQIQIPTLYRG